MLGAKFNTLDDLVEMAQAHDERCHDTKEVNVRSMNYGQGLLSFGGNVANGFFNNVLTAKENGRLNDHALTQLADRLGAPRPKWLMNEVKCPEELKALVLNWKFENNPEADYLVRQITEGDENVVRSVLSSQYSIYDNFEFVKTVVDAVKEGGLDVHVWRPQCDDTLRAYIIVKGRDFQYAGDWTGDEEQARAHPMGDGSSPALNRPGRAEGIDGGGNGGLQPAIYVSNNEVGGGRVRIHGGLYRAWCANGAIVGWEISSNVGVTHRFKSSEHMAALVNHSIADAMKMSEEAALAFLKKRAVYLKKVKLSSIVDRWGDKYGLVVETKELWNTQLTLASQQHENVSAFDMINMLTVVRSEDENQQEQIERCAGDMILADVPWGDRVDEVN